MGGSVIKTNFTRGSGLFENLLSKKRAALAAHYIRKHNGPQTSILDIGCGTFPFFLSRVNFTNKYALDRIPVYTPSLNIHFTNQDLQVNVQLPFEDNTFDVITALAFVEHVNDANRKKLFLEIYRVLKRGGMFFLTTPCKWTESILIILAKLNMVSREELREHKDLLTRDELKELLILSGFDRHTIQSGRFEAGLNLYEMAVK
ncbi:MAG: methyltransferase domain-containing protein [candidate division KSB1 bacterium]|nr:methyltransferase domain-containing protein [candidate division KSB1 bacterium]